MTSEHALWQTIRWPLAVLLAGAVGVVGATILDEVYSSEWSLTIGAPSLGLLLPIGAVWLVVALVTYFVHNRRTD